MPLLHHLQVVAPVGLLFATVYLLAGVYAGSNAFQIGKGYSVSHLWEARERLAAVGPACALAFLGDMLYTPHFLLGASCILTGFVLSAILFGLRFDVQLNKRRGLDKYYLGVGRESATIDLLANTYLSGKQFYYLKLITTILGFTALVGARYLWSTP